MLFRSDWATVRPVSRVPVTISSCNSGTFCADVVFVVAGAAASCAFALDSNELPVTRGNSASFNRSRCFIIVSPPMAPSMENGQVKLVMR